MDRDGAQREKGGGEGGRGEGDDIPPSYRPALGDAIGRGVKKKTWATLYGSYAAWHGNGFWLAMLANETTAWS